MFPLADSVKSGKIPFAVLIFIAVNSLVFIKQFSQTNYELFVSQFALTPSLISLLNPMTLVAFISSIFLHGGFFHIFSNMWFLWIFGDNVEAKLGKIKFIALFILSGIAGNILQYSVAPTSNIPILGASGAVSGILGAYMILFPTEKIKTLLLLFFSISIVEIPALIYIFYWFVIQLFSGIASLPMSFQSGGIAFWAHIGGFIFGIWFIRKFKKSNNRKNQEIIEGEIVG